MGGKVLAHLDDGRMLPLVEMRPGEKGHVECVNGGDALREGMAALGLKDDDPIELIRVLPPMEFTALVTGRGRRMGKVCCQFANAQAGADFTVEQIIGGSRAKRAIESLDIRPGMILRLETVGKAPSYQMAARNRCVVTSPTGLRLFLRQDQADLVVVSYDDETGACPP